MSSDFSKWSEQEQRLFIAKVIHNINYSQSSLEMMQSIVNFWEEHPIRQAVFFTQNLKTQKTLQYGTSN
jgi:hypothetical protein